MVIVSMIVGIIVLYYVQRHIDKQFEVVERTFPFSLPDSSGSRENIREKILAQSKIQTGESPSNVIEFDKQRKSKTKEPSSKLPTSK